MRVKLGVKNFTVGGIWVRGVQEKHEKVSVKKNRLQVGI